MNPFNKGDMVIFSDRASKDQRKNIIFACGPPPYQVQSTNYEWTRIQKIGGRVDGWHFKFFVLQYKMTLPEDLFNV